MAARKSLKFASRILVCLVFMQSWDSSFALGSSCRSTEENPSLLFSAVTAYDVVRGTEVQDETEQGCETIQFYLMARHGSRYDTAGGIQEISDTLPGIRDRIVQAADQGELCTADLNSIRDWLMRMEVSLGYFMADTGIQEMKDMATRFKTRFPSLLNKAYAQDEFLFRNTEAPGDERTRKSAEAYVEALFGSKVGVNITQVPEEEDTLLRIYKNCPIYKETVSNKNVEEQAKFMMSQEVKDMLLRINTRLGFENDKLQFGTIMVIYRACSFEYAVYKDSPWCAVFSSEDLNVLDYARDLFFYYREGYGHAINYDMSCTTITDIVEHFKSAMDTGKPGAVHRIAHHGNIHGLILRLGLFKDETPLTADNFDPGVPKMWNTSMTTPEAANIALALYKCGAEYKIKLFVNEKAHILPPCQQELCPLDTVWEQWQTDSESCDAEELCEVEITAEAVSITGGRIWLLTIFILLYVFYI